MAETGAAELLRHQQAAKAHLGKRLPHLRRVAARVVVVAQLAKMCNRRLVDDQAARAVAQQGLFFVQNESHERSVSSTLSLCVFHVARRFLCHSKRSDDWIAS